MPGFDVVGVGCCAWDYLAVVETHPPIDTKCDALLVEEQGGGPTATAMVTLARLGAKTALAGKVGDDGRGRLIISALEREGVDVRQIKVGKDESSRLSLVIVEQGTGKRTVVSMKGSAAPLKPEELDRSVITSGRILHVDGHQMAAATVAARWAREAGLQVVLDAGSVKAGMEELASLADYVVASEPFALDSTGEDSIEQAARRLYRDGNHSAVVVTGGERGGFLVSEQGEQAYDAFRVDSVDTTGAGDVFHGAFDYGILRGWELSEVVEFGAAVAAIKCRSLGGRAGIPSLSEVAGFLAEHRPLRGAAG